MTLHSCLHTSRFLSKGVIRRSWDSCISASPLRHCKKLSRSARSSSSAVVLESHCGLLGTVSLALFSRCFPNTAFSSDAERR